MGKNLQKYNLHVRAIKKALFSSLFVKRKWLGIYNEKVKVEKTINKGRNAILLYREVNFEYNILFSFRQSLKKSRVDGT